MSGPLLLAIESSCDETGVALVEGGRRIHRNVVASQVAMHAAAGGIVPEVAARAHLRWIVPVLDEVLDGAGVTPAELDGIAVTYGPGLAGSLLVGINMAKALAWVHDLPLIGVNHLEGHVYAGWLLDPGEDEAARPEPVFPLVALVVSGGHTFLAEMRDHLTYRLLGTTVDDAAGEAFDKVGRLLGLGYPGGPAIQAAAEGATRRDVVFPRAWMGDSYDWSFSGLKTAARRIVAEARLAEGLAADDTDAAPCAGDRGRAGLRASRHSVVDVLVTKTIRAAEAVGRAFHRARRRRGREQRAARRAGRACPRPRAAADRAATRAVHRQRGDDRRRRRPPLRGRGAGRHGPRRPAVPAPGRAMSGGPARIDPAEVRATLKAAGLRARHGLSQNFLADADVLDAILAEADPGPGGRVLEIGPGLGLLTGALLAAGAAVTAVELDRGLAGFLRERFEGALGGRAADAHRGRRPGPGPRPAAGAAVRRGGQPAVPHHLARSCTPCWARRRGPRRAVLMVQREVGERITAPPGKMSYLSVFVQYHARARVAFLVPPTAFEPAPAVDSAVIVVEPFDADDRLDPDTEDGLWRLVQAAFRERRKMIHNVLSRQLPVDASRVAAALAAAEIDPGPAAADAGGGGVAAPARDARADRRGPPRPGQGRALTWPARDAHAAPVLRLAPAKLNLTLAVVGRRPDGYHDLHSVFVPLALADRLSLAPLGRRDRDTRRCRRRRHAPRRGPRPRPGRRQPRPARHRGRAGVRWASGPGRPPTPALAARLDKRIPVAAGLGGGSSDAAAALDGALEAWGADLDADRRMAIAASIGSDVPFFLAGGAALVEGRGERVTALAGPRGAVGVLLVTPALPCARRTSSRPSRPWPRPAAHPAAPATARSGSSSEHLAAELRPGMTVADLVTRAGRAGRGQRSAGRRRPRRARPRAVPPGADAGHRPAHRPVRLRPDAVGALSFGGRGPARGRGRAQRRRGGRHPGSRRRPAIDHRHAHPAHAHRAQPKDQGGARIMTRHAVSTTGAPSAIGPYSQGIVSGDLVFCSGQLGLDPATGDLVEGGVEAQTERALRNLASVLDAAGASMADVVKTTHLPGRHRRLRGGQRGVRPAHARSRPGAVHVRRRRAAQGRPASRSRPSPGAVEGRLTLARGRPYHPATAHDIH